jgi:hypothetical protein
MNAALLGRIILLRAVRRSSACGHRSSTERHALGMSLNNRRYGSSCNGLSWSRRTC